MGNNPKPICPYCGNHESYTTRIRATQIGYRCKSPECDRQFTLVLTYTGWGYHRQTLKSVEAYQAKMEAQSSPPKRLDRPRDLGDVLDARGIGRAVNAADLS